MAIERVKVTSASIGDDRLAKRGLRADSVSPAGLGVICGFTADFAYRSRHRRSPDEEFAVFARAQEELE